MGCGASVTRVEVVGLLGMALAGVTFALGQWVGVHNERYRNNRAARRRAICRHCGRGPHPDKLYLDCLRYTPSQSFFREA